MARGSSWRLAVAGVLVAVCAAAALAPPAAALDIGIQSAGDGAVRTRRPNHGLGAYTRYHNYLSLIVLFDRFDPPRACRASSRRAAARASRTTARVRTTTTTTIPKY